MRTDITANELSLYVAIAVAIVYLDEVTSTDGIATALKHLRVARDMFIEDAWQ